MGAHDYEPPLEILTNAHFYSLLIRRHYSLKPFFFSFFVSGSQHPMNCEEVKYHG